MWAADALFLCGSWASCNSMALHSLYCADVPLRNCSLTHSPRLLVLHLSDLHVRRLSKVIVLRHGIWSAVVMIPLTVCLSFRLFICLWRSVLSLNDSPYSKSVWTSKYEVPLVTQFCSFKPLTAALSLQYIHPKIWNFTFLIKTDHFVYVATNMAEYCLRGDD